MAKHLQILQAKEIIEKEYGGRIRVRVCGVCEQNGKYLLANHYGINGLANFWCPPGGGVEFGETIEEALRREYWEEASLEIAVNEFLAVYEYIKRPLHAVELFYKVIIKKGNLKTGVDPETGNSVLKEVKWMGVDEIRKLNIKEIHQHFHLFFELK